MHVRVELFGRTSSQTGERSVELEVPAGSTLRQVAEALVARFPVLDWVLAACRPARNLEYAHWGDPAAEGDEISFIPPVSGGCSPAGEPLHPEWKR